LKELLIRTFYTLVVIIQAFAFSTELKAQFSAAGNFDDSYTAYTYTKAKDYALATRYDSAAVILGDLIVAARDSQPDEYLELCEAFIDNLIVTHRTADAYAGIVHAHAYWRERHASLKRPDTGLSDIYLQYGRLAQQFKSKSMRYVGLDFFRLALRLVPRDNLRSGILERKIGMTNRLLGHDAKVMPAYLRSLELLQGLNCREQVRTLQEIGIFHYRGQDSAQTFQYFTAARTRMASCREIHPDDKIIQLYYEGKLETEFRDDAENAERIFQQASAVSRVYNCYSPLLPYVFSALGTVQSNRGFNEDARMTFQNYLHYHQEVTHDSSRIGQAYLYLGKCLTSLGDYDAALQHYDEAYGILVTYDQNQTAIADLYQNYGSVMLNLQHYSQALAYLDSALSRYLEYFPEDHNNIGTIYYSIGLAYEKLLQPAKAEFQYRLAIDQFGRDRQPNWGNVAHNHTLIANALVRRGFVNAAERELALARAALKKTDAYDVVNISESLLEMGNYAFEQGRYDEALDHFQEALTVVVSGYKNTDPTDFPNLANAIARLQALETMEGKAISFRGRYGVSGEVSDLVFSLKAYQMTIEMIREVRQDHREEGSKLLLAQKRRPIFEAAIQVAWELFQLTGDAAYKAQAFGFSEQSKAMILLEAVSATNAERISGIPPDMLSRKQRLLRQIDLLQQDLRNAENPVAAGDLRTRLFDLRNQHTAILDTFAKDFPKYFELVYGFRTAQPQQVMDKMASENCTLVEYFTGDSALYTFAFSPDTFVVRRTRLSKVFLDSLDGFRRFLTEPGASNASAHNYAQNARMLYDTLLGCLPLSLEENLVVVPDGRLNFLSFDALVTEAPKLDNPKFNELRYLLHDHVVSYNYSATFLMRPPRLVSDSADVNILALAPGFSTANGLADLGGARENVARLTDKYPGVTALLDGDATKSGFLSRAASYDILDLATHGSVDTLDPMNSRLFFAPDGGGDSILYLYELYTMPLRARLAILEACETGAGTLQRGEGVMSMARGFTYAGCNGVVMSLWQAADASSSGIIDRFYEGLADGKKVDQALTQAKRDFLEDSQSKGGMARQNYHPFFWSPLVIIGDTAPIPVKRLKGSSWSSVWWITLAGLVVLMVGFGVWSRRKKGKAHNSPRSMDR
jgi:CHAT domain-containing protein